MDSLPQLYLNGTALKGYDYEKQLYITTEQFLEMVLKGDLHPRNECGEYLLQEPNPLLRKLELFLQVIPHSLLRVEDEEGTSMSATRYEDGGTISATVYNNKKDWCTGERISHAKQLEKYAGGDKYVYKHYKTAVISWLREQVYDLPMIYEWDAFGEMDFIEIKINGEIKKIPVAFHCSHADGTHEITPLLGCRLPFTDGDDPLVSPEIMRKMPLLHYKLAKDANQPDDFLIEIVKQGLQDAGYKGPMPAISGDATEFLSLMCENENEADRTVQPPPTAFAVMEEAQEPILSTEEIVKIWKRAIKKHASISKELNCALMRWLRRQGLDDGAGKAESLAAEYGTNRQNIWIWEKRGLAKGEKLRLPSLL
ncbi:hypothetical protein [Desulfovibrio desulfuricans]|uniref:hypothetical protein n=1 Tax=Desulfovibrio desulfuricans TaxID=876 RepID=UPI001C0324F3|nr:hypothetical protein [Desulfovibrio desulfuricans]MBT9748536.1 hypothetical protein [Desulfovibrio desulfuricans]